MLSLAICAVILFLTASATTVTIIDSSYADRGGFFLQPYFENLNAPVTGCTAPCLTVDTQTTEPTLTRGTPSLDGSGYADSTSGTITSISTTITTSNKPDVIILLTTTQVATGAGYVTVSSVSATGLTFTKRTSTTAAVGGFDMDIEEWYAIATSTLTALTVTVTYSGTITHYVTLDVFGVKGANTNSPFDPSSSLPSVKTAAAATITTAYRNDFLFGFELTDTTASPTHGTGWTAINTPTGAYFGSEYQEVSSTQSALAVTWSNAASDADGMIGDAIQASNSFTLPAGSSMYLWSPQFTTAATVPAGTLSIQLFADLPAPALDGSATGTWSSGTTFTIASFSTTKPNDVIVLSIQTYGAGTAISVSSVSDSQAKVTWKSSARNSLTSCTGADLSTNTEWYGIAATALTTDTITVTLSSAPTSASGIAFGVSGADTTTPFDPATGLPKTGVSSCTFAAAAPTVSGVTTVADTDFVFAAYGGYTSTTETAGTIGTLTPSIVKTVAGTGDSNAVEYTATTTALSGASCSFETTTTYWGALCDAIMPARQTVTVSYITTNSAGTVQSTMISSSPATITAFYQPITLPSSAGSVPASGYIRVIITAPSAAAITVFWGYGKPTLFQVAYTYRQ
jgi:hypothetical protein